MNNTTKNSTKRIALELCTADLRIDPKKFHTLKFLLEGYDNLAILSSVDNKKGIVRLRFAQESEGELFSVLSSISHQIEN